MLQRYKELKDIIAILGMDELSEDDKLVARAEKLKDFYQAIFVAEVFTGNSGKYVSLEEHYTNCDDLPEQAFYSGHHQKPWKKQSL